MHLLRLSPSLQRVLLLPYIALVLGLSLVIGVFSYRSGSQSVEEVARHLLTETVQRIGISVQQQLGTAALRLWCWVRQCPRACRCRPTFAASSGR